MSVPVLSKLDPPVGTDFPGVPPVTELISFGHSLSYGFGTSSPEFAWTQRVAKTLGADLEVYAQSGAILAYDDSNASTDGGWPTVYKRLLRLLNRTAAPYIANWGAVSLHYGANDLSNYGSGTGVQAAVKSALRACIGISRSARWWQANDAAVTKSGASHNFLPGSEDSAIGGRIDYITAADGSYWQLAIPADYPGNGAVWIITASQTTNGMLASVTVDGGSPASINGQAVTTIDSRGVALVAGISSIQGFRVPISGAGAHTLRVTPTTITGSVAGLEGFALEADTPPIVVMPNQYKLPSYTPYVSAGAAFPPDDTAFDALSAWITAVASEVPDGRVIVADLDTPINKQTRYLYSDGVHLNDAGHEVAAAAILDAIARYVPRSRQNLVASAKKGAVPYSRTPAKAACRFASPTNVTVSSAPATIDGGTPDYFNRVLLCNQTAPAENGIYLWLGATRPMERANDFDSPQELVKGAKTYVQEGSTLAGSEFMLATTGTIVVGTTALYFTRSPARTRSGGLGDSWIVGGNQLEHPMREYCTGSLTLVTAKIHCFGGMVLPAGRAINGLGFWATTAGTLTARWVALVRQSDMVVLAVSANNASAFTANALTTQAFTSAYTAPVDTPVYRAVGIVASVAPVLVAAAAVNSTFALASPIIGGQSTTAASATPPTVGATLGALTTAIPQVAWGVAT